MKLDLAFFHPELNLAHFRSYEILLGEYIKDALFVYNFISVSYSSYSMYNSMRNAYTVRFTRYKC